MAAATIVLAEEIIVYRGLRNSNWSKSGRITWKAFMLRPATPDFPIEQTLSLGLSPESAVDELRENHGVAKLLVAAIHGLPHGLSVKSDPEDRSKAELYGLPLHSAEPTQIDLAITMATDLAYVSVLVPPTP